MLALLICIAFAGCQKQRAASTTTAPATQQASSDPAVKQGTAFVDAMAKGDFASATGQFDPKMTAVMPADKLKTTWQAAEAQYGAYQQQLSTQVQAVSQGGQQFKMVIVTCQFAKAKVDVKPVLDPDGKIGGLWFAQSGQ